MRAIAIALMLFAAGCTSHDDARRAAQAAGFTDVQTGGIDIWACGERDMEGREFRARNAQGVAVSGVVCCGYFFKGCTVRF